MRGERGVGFGVVAIIAGSSPHARGTPNRREGGEYRRRFIPACAGNASKSPSLSLSSPVHPRMRGERMSYEWQGMARHGSSPQARGPLVIDGLRVFLRRFIPACAGNAGIDSFQARPHAVHPRMRGERIITAPDYAQMIGSSPHARGTRGGSQFHQSQERFIPACAGNA